MIGTLAADAEGRPSCIGGLGAPAAGDVIEPSRIAGSCAIAAVADVELSCEDGFWTLAAGDVVELSNVA